MQHLLVFVHFLCCKDNDRLSASPSAATIPSVSKVLRLHNPVVEVNGDIDGTTKC